MSNSYVPANTLVNCTHMTAPKPQELQAIRGIQSVSHTKGILLTVEDKKISNTFICKNPKKFWNGIMTMCAGIAVGALALAVVVGTGGAAAPVVVGLVCAGIGSSFVAAGTGVIGHFASHDCDPTLESEWILEHTSVKFNGSFALLQQSILKCQNGGMVTIFMNEVVSIDAAKEYASNNNQEALIHAQYQFFEGIVSGVTALTPVGIIIGFACGASDYIDDEKQNQIKQQEMAETILKGKHIEENNTTAIDIGELSTDIMKDINIGIATDMAETLIKKESKEYVFDAQWVDKDNIAGTGWKGTVKGGTIGIIGTIVNHILENISSEKEKEFYIANLKDFTKTLEISRHTKGINVISKEN